MSNNVPEKQIVKGLADGVAAETPLDSVVAGKIATISGTGRGFVMDLASEIDDGGKKTVIEVRESLRPRDLWIAPADLKRHSILSPESFVAYALKYGDAEKSLIFYDEERFVLIIDETIREGEREVVTMPVKLSSIYADFAGLIGEPQGHKGLLTELASNRRYLADPTMLMAMRSIKLNSSVNMESDIQDDGKTLGVMVKTNAGESLAKFPKHFGINVPVLDGDEMDDSLWLPAEVDVNIELPDEPKELPTFTLTSPNFSLLPRHRVRQIADEVRSALEGWTIINGKMATAPVRYGDRR